MYVIYIKYTERLS